MSTQNSFYKTFARLSEAEQYCRDNGAEFHHETLARGYRSTQRYDKDRKPFSVEPYQGKYGDGFIVRAYNNCPIFKPKSNRYYSIEYFIKK